MSAKDIITKTAHQQKRIIELVDEEFKNGSPNNPHKSFKSIEAKMLEEDLMDKGSENKNYMKSYFSEKMYSIPDLEEIDVQTEK